MIKYLKVVAVLWALFGVIGPLSQTGFPSVHSVVRVGAESNPPVVDPATTVNS